MLVAKLLIAALGTFPGFAIAAPSSSGSGLMSLMERGQGSCPSGMDYNGFQRKCKCDDDDHYYGDDDDNCYDRDQKRCHAKPHPKNPCGYGEKQYCAKSQDEWCEYDKNNKFCYDYKNHKTFCCKPEDIHKKLREQCPTHPKCPDEQHWDYKHGECKCPKGKVWRKNHCVWKPLPKPKCKGKQIAYCAKDTDHFCQYDEWNDWCGDDSRHITFCCEPDYGKPQKKCKNKWNNGKGWDNDD